jgi:hypothetical protein
MRRLEIILVAAIILSACVPFSSDFHNPQTAQKASCQTWRPIYGDFFSAPDTPYCKCVSGLLAAGYRSVNGENCNFQLRAAPSNSN